jgi:hypothetical protein
MSLSMSETITLLIRRNQQADFAKSISASPFSAKTRARDAIEFFAQFLTKRRQFTKGIRDPIFDGVRSGHDLALAYGLIPVLIVPDFVEPFLELLNIPMAIFVTQRGRVLGNARLMFVQSCLQLACRLRLIGVVGFSLGIPSRTIGCPAGFTTGLDFGGGSVGLAVTSNDYLATSS